MATGMCQHGFMPEVDRRAFLKTLGLAGAGLVAGGTILGITSCSDTNENTDPKDAGTSKAALIVSSDLYKSDIAQRFAFTIFNKTDNVAKGTVPVTITSPTGKVTKFAGVKVRKAGLSKGLFSLYPILNETGNWQCDTKFEGESLSLAFSVAELAQAPIPTGACPAFPTPTDADPLDAQDLCTRFKGNCGLHKSGVPDLLATKKPFAVLFATPARCQTGYCAPILDVVRDRAKNFSFPTVHIEIYKSETSNERLDAVRDWNLPSEPWLFTIDASGKVQSRLDGAFDGSEVNEVFAKLGA